jgi:hypothetical protein
VRSFRFLWLYAITTTLLLVAGVWILHRRPPASVTTNNTASLPSTVSRPVSNRELSGATDVYAHNLMLRKGPTFRVYVRWLRGKMLPTQRNVAPSFDDPDSFVIDIATGVLRANIGDIGNYLNAGGLGNSPLKNVKLSGDGNQIKLVGTLHKMISLPVELDASIAPLPDSRIQIHVNKITVLKIPFKALLGAVHITLADFVDAKNLRGVQVTGNDLYISPEQLLPPPHIRGHLTAVRVVNPDLEEVFGDAQGEVERVEQWRNFLRLKGGSINFGRLIMQPVDILMVDVSNDVWFDLDLAHYQKQLVYGYTRMTPQAGLQIFMPDLKNIPATPESNDISMEWMKNRETPPPKEVLKR